MHSYSMQHAVMCKPSAGPGAQDCSAGARSTQGSGTVPGAQRCPFAQRFPGGDPSSPPRRCPWSGQSSGSPVPSGLGSTRGEFQQGWGRVGRGLSMGPSSQLHPAQLSPLLRTVMLLWFGFTLGQPRGVPAQYIPSHPPAPSPCRAHQISAHHSAEVGTAQRLLQGCLHCSPIRVWAPGSPGTVLLRGGTAATCPGGHAAGPRWEGSGCHVGCRPCAGLLSHCTAPPPA